MSVEVRNLTFSYGARRVLSEIGFSVPDGSLTAVLGPNGVGKSTLFRCILGLLHGYTGEILLSGENARGMDAHALAKRIAYIPQSSYPAFNYTVLDMVLMGASAQGATMRGPNAAEMARARASLEKMGMADFEGRDYMRLSGGERQLILIARALAQQTQILIMDEPTANLDFGNQMRVLNRVRTLADEGYAVIFSTHHPEQAYQFADQIVAMLDGRVFACGAPQDVLNEETIQALYAMETEIISLLDDRVRVCVPKFP